MESSFRYEKRSTSQVVLMVCLSGGLLAVLWFLLSVGALVQIESLESLLSGLSDVKQEVLFSEEWPFLMLLVAREPFG